MKWFTTAWDDSVSTKNGDTVVTHVLARRFILVITVGLDRAVRGITSQMREGLLWEGLVSSVP